MPEAPAIPEWSVSIVSHGHMAGVRKLLVDLRQHAPIDRFELILTLNVHESTDRVERVWPGRFTLIRNPVRKGFAANHNAALRRAKGRFVAALDPELRLHGDPFGALGDALTNPRAGIVTTPVYDEDGTLADNARSMLSPSSLLRRYTVGAESGNMARLSEPVPVDWIAGLFMAMRADTFRRLNGFDERYFLYCEDADLCMRAWNEGLEVKVVPGPVVTHVAQRQTLKRMKHFVWHCDSLLRLWRSPAYRGFKQKNLQGSAGRE